MSTIEVQAFKEGRFVVKEETWGGAENKVSSIAFNVSPNTPQDRIEFTHVLKEPREISYFETLYEKYPPHINKENDAYEYLIRYFKSQEYFLNTEADFRLALKIFGEMIPETDFVIHTPRTGNKMGFYIIQKKVNGLMWNTFTKEKTREQNYQYIMQRRGQLMELIGGARRILIETGATVDIWEENLMVSEEGMFRIVDPGPSSEFERQFEKLINLPQELRIVLANNMLKRIGDLDKYPDFIKMTKDETEKMNREFGISEDKYTSAKDRLVNKSNNLLG